MMQHEMYPALHAASRQMILGVAQVSAPGIGTEGRLRRQGHSAQLLVIVVCD